MKNGGMILSLANIKIILINSMNYNNLIFVGTTSNHGKDFIELPPKKIFGIECKNYSVNSEAVLYELFDKNPEATFVLDVEKKQKYSLINLVKNYKNNVRFIDYKPNDITLEAADIAILKYYGYDLYGKSIGVYGTGNISFKLALRLVERNCNVFLYGRNEEKVKDICKVINNITFGNQFIEQGQFNEQLDCFVSFVSAKEIISSTYLDLLNADALCIDGGIGNFTKDFIEKANELGLNVRRLDVRQANEVLEGYIKSKLDNSFDAIIGKNTINDINIVAGGIIGKDSEIIVDRIDSPNRVIGVANGIGGLKSSDNLSKKDLERIENINEYIRENK
ncbi:NAD(P)-binding domain-containing protein [Macrococcus animalis]|uniref:NAD(P)-binding domain-containing protein n=1 Tax=Macrococcus animalis TaxID=3395467 RepID=UPI0039BDDE83